MEQKLKEQKLKELQKRLEEAFRNDKSHIEKLSENQ